MRKFISIFAFAMIATASAHAGSTSVKGLWGTDALNWEISGTEQTQLWDLFTGSKQKLFKIQKSDDGVYALSDIDGQSNLSFSYSPELSVFKGKLDGKSVDLTVKHTNLGTHWFEGVFKNHRPSLRIDVPSEQRVEGRATGFYKNELADLYIIRQEHGYWFKGYMNGYWIDLTVQRNGDTYTFEGSYLNKKMSLTVTSNQSINDVIEYLLLDMPIPNSDFLNLGDFK
ncbi:hypothetical protein [Bdellovibrio sp. HCB209]|uniref:hypothetical protein n=1 Tax=Bdellovibrio sp. HCB209 TaxID=3394354 RepID=UPI0039B42901